MNQSGYLIFYPNLTQAYGYLDRAEAVRNASPASAVLYAEEAQSSAAAQYGAIGGYRNLSFAIIAVLAAGAAAAVLFSMRKARGGKKRGMRRRGRAGG